MTPITLRIREVRLSRGLTQVQLAKAAGVQQAAISSLETRELQKIDVGVLERVAAALDVDPALLIKSVPLGASTARKTHAARKTRKR
jgi:transcriptional regulator with XRE-family HTH domain